MKYVLLYYIYLCNLRPHLTRTTQNLLFRKYFSNILFGKKHLLKKILKIFQTDLFPLKFTKNDNLYNHWLTKNKSTINIVWYLEYTTSWFCIMKMKIIVELSRMHISVCVCKQCMHTLPCEFIYPDTVTFHFYKY